MTPGVATCLHACLPACGWLHIQTPAFICHSHHVLYTLCSLSLLLFLPLDIWLLALVDERDRARERAQQTAPLPRAATMSDARDDNRSSSSSSAFSYTDAPRAAGSASSDDVADDDVDARRAPRVDTTTATMSAREQHGGAVTEAQGARAGERPFSLLSEPETPSNDDRPREPSAAAGAFARLAISEQQQSRTPRGTAAAAAAAAAAAEEVLESGTSSERWREVALDSNSAQAAHDGDEHEQEAAGELDSDRLAKALEMQCV